MMRDQLIMSESGRIMTENDLTTALGGVHEYLVQVDVYIQRTSWWPLSPKSKMLMVRTSYFDLFEGHETIERFLNAPGQRGRRQYSLEQASLYIGEFERRENDERLMNTLSSMCKLILQFPVNEGELIVARECS